MGFEPTLPFRVNTLSKRAPSATRPSLQRRVTTGSYKAGTSYRRPSRQQLPSRFYVVQPCTATTPELRSFPGRAAAGARTAWETIGDFHVSVGVFGAAVPGRISRKPVKGALVDDCPGGEEALEVIVTSQGGDHQRHSVLPYSSFSCSCCAR